MASPPPPNLHSGPPPQDPSPQFFQSGSNLQNTSEKLAHVSLGQKKDSKQADYDVEEHQKQDKVIAQGDQWQVRSMDPDLQKQKDAVIEQRSNPHAQSSINIQQLEELDLTAIMQSLHIAIPEEVAIGYQGEEIQRPEENSPFQLLMKVGCSSGSPRNIPLRPLNEAMSKAWGKNYWVIDQVDHAIYKAYFRDDEAMDFVLQKQPWSIDGDNLLLEWIDPTKPSKNIDDYSFNTIYVPIRVYGVPERYRVPTMMKYVIDKVAQPSDIHPPPEIRMTVKQDFVQAYAKMDVHVPVKDKIKYYVAPDKYIMFYLNYDRVKRICTFCGFMFHTVQYCPNRRKLIQHLISIGANTSSVPFSYVGIWTSQASKIPQMALDQSKIITGLSQEVRRSMNIDRTVGGIPKSLSGFTLLESNSGQKHTTGKDTQIHQNSNKTKGNLLVSSSQPSEVRYAGVGLLGPPPAHNRVDMSQQMYPSTLAMYNIQQASGSTISLHKPKRQDNADPVSTQNCDDLNGQSPVRFKSVPPSSPQYSGTASSSPHSSDKSFSYRPLTYAAPNDLMSASSGERKNNRPRKRSRWDERKDQNNHQGPSVPNTSPVTHDSYVAGAIHQAQQIASNVFSGNNNSPALVHNIHLKDQPSSSPTLLQRTYDSDQYKAWLENETAATLGPSSQDNHHWGMLHPPLTDNMEGVEGDQQVHEEQAAAPASKAPRAQ